MSRLMLSCGFSALLFAVGVFAGQSVHSDPVPSSGGRYDVGTSRSTLTSGSSQENDPSPIRTVSSQQFTVDAETPSDVGSVAAASDSVNGAESRTPTDSSGRLNVLNLIRRIFPDADEETASIWADVYAGMDLSEVQFILEQKRMLSGTLAVSGSTALEGSLWKLADQGLSTSEGSTPMAAALKAVQHNLRGAWSIGFRRTVVLPEVLPSKETLLFSLPEQIQTTMFVCFDAGRTISSPVATHVALPTDDGSVMFRLEGLRLTRRGDFLLLPGRRLGLMTQSETFALEDSPQIPDDASAVRITKAREIEVENSAGETKLVGTLSVLKVIDLAKLTTRDGVIFTIEAANPLSAVQPVTPELSTNTLELSNVTAEEERRLFEHLTSLLPGK